jgi:hypothetical protein
VAVAGQQRSGRRKDVLNLRNLARAVVAAVVTGAAVFVSALPAGAADGVVGGG